MEFIRHPDYLQKRSALIYFSGLLGYNMEHKQWQKPGIWIIFMANVAQYTPILSGLIFCIRILVLEDTFPSSSRAEISNQGLNPMPRFHEILNQWLVEGEPTVFNHFHKLLNLGITIGKETKSRTRIRWSQNAKKLYVGHRVLKISRWKPFIRELLDMAEDMMSELLFLKKGIIPKTDLNKIVDDPDKREAGYYFALDEEGAYKKARTRMMERLGQSDKWDKMVENLGDELTFLATGVNDYLSLDEKFRVLLCIIIILTCGVTGRCREMTSMLYLNTMEADRNILVEDGQIMMIAEYHKSMAMMDDLKVRQI
jgi:hypothetical protein